LQNLEIPPFLADELNFNKKEVMGNPSLLQTSV